MTQTAPYPIVRPTKYNPVPVETKQAIIDNALDRIGNEGLREIAASHGVDTRTLNVWLLALPEYTEKCKAITDARLVEAREQFDKDREAIQTATDQFTLAQARDAHQVSKSDMAYAVMMAERRDSRYASKQEQTVTTAPTFIVVMASNEKVIEHDKPQHVVSSVE